MTIYMGIDDTDTVDRPGTGRLARSLASHLSTSCHITGVTRHQLYVHPAIPFTSHNSCAVIHIADDDDRNLNEIFQEGKEIIAKLFVEGSDPGIAIGKDSQIGPALVNFGIGAKSTVLTQGRARQLAKNSGILLEGLGGTEDGVIGALAGVGLAATGNDGRYIMKNHLRQLHGTLSIDTLIDAGVDIVITPDGRQITEGYVTVQKFPKPMLLMGKAVLLVEVRNSSFPEIVRG